MFINNNLDMITTLYVEGAALDLERVWKHFFKLIYSYLCIIGQLCILCCVTFQIGIIQMQIGNLNNFGYDRMGMDRDLDLPYTFGGAILHPTYST